MTTSWPRSAHGSRWRLLLCGALFGACSESPPDAMQSAGRGGDGVAVAGHGGNAGGARANAAAGSGGASGAGGRAGAAAEGGTGGGAGSAQIERSTVAADDSPDVTDADYGTFTKQFASFGIELGQKLSASEGLATENLVYSPLSAAYALTMTYAGARGQTAAEMKTVLGDTFKDGVYHSAANRLGRELASRAIMEMGNQGKVRKVELNLAGALFLERTLEVQPPFLDLLAREYNSGVQRLDFMNAHEAARLTINGWVEDQTREKITDLLPTSAIDERTPFVLVNALYFYGSWRVPFPHEGTHAADFHRLVGDTVQVPTMNAYRVQTGYASSADYSLAELSYVGEKLSMIVVLPAQGKFESVRSMLSGAWLDAAIASLEPSLLNVALPKFKLTVGSFSLKRGLEALGMKQAFTDAADFTGMAPGVLVTEVLQKCFIAVDEDGTEAAAATAVIGGPTSAPVDQPIPFVVDRPFMFFVRDANGIILFSGHVVDPAGAE